MQSDLGCGLFLLPSNQQGSSGVPYLCPADDFAVGFELGAAEDLDAGDGLHRLAIDWTDHTELLKHTEHDRVELNHMYNVFTNRAYK